MRTGSATGGKKPKTMGASYSTSPYTHISARCWMPDLKVSSPSSRRRLGKVAPPNGLGNLMREWCDQAGLPNCTSHGLRKAIARRLAEAGDSPHEIIAVTGHLTLAEVTRYTSEVNRHTIADGAITLEVERSRDRTLANLQKMFVRKTTKPLNQREKKCGWRRERDWRRTFSTSSH